jgi:hypothetical protein
VVWWLRQWTVKLYDQQQFETKVKDLDLEYFLFVTHLLRFLDLILHQEVPKLFYQQELRGLVDKRTAK